MAGKGKEEKEEGADKLSSGSDEMVLDGVSYMSVTSHVLEGLLDHVVRHLDELTVRD